MLGQAVGRFLFGGGPGVEEIDSEALDFRAVSEPADVC